MDKTDEVLKIKNICQVHENNIGKYISQKKMVTFDFSNDDLIYVGNILGRLMNARAWEYFNNIFKNKIDTEINMLINEIIKNDILLISLCALHINTKEKIKKLENMLISWNQQTYKIKMIISISYDESIKNDMEQLINKQFNKYGNDLIIIDNKINKKTQFEHYKIISKKYYDIYHTHYVIFTDDDDIWNNNRTAIYNILLQYDKITGLQYDYISYPFICESINNYASEYKNVFIDNETTKNIFSDEYVTYCTKFQYLKFFIDNSDTRLLSDNLCDRYFGKFLKNCNKYLRIHVPFFGWIYNYNNTKFCVPVDQNYENFDDYIIIKANNILNCYYSENYTNEHTNKQFNGQYEFENSNATNNTKYTKNMMYSKYSELINSKDYDYLKNSPILTTYLKY